jgi:hypothetical protein
MMKIEGSGSGSISQRYGSPDSDPHQNVMDPEHCAGRNEEDGDGEPRRKKIKLEPLEESAAAAAAGSAVEARGEEEGRKRKFGPIWMIPHLVKGLRFLQTKILQVRGTERDKE